MSSHLRIAGVGAPIGPREPADIPSDPSPRPIPPRTLPLPPNTQPPAPSYDPGSGGRPDPLPVPGVPDVQPPIPNPVPPLPTYPTTSGVYLPGGYQLPAALQRPWIKAAGLGILMFAVGIGVGYSIGRVRRGSL